MKLRYQSFLLIGLPLAFQLLFVGVLVSMSTSLEGAAAKEAHAKMVLSQCDSLRMVMFANCATLASMRMTQSKDFSAAMEHARQRNEQKIVALRKLVVEDDGVARASVDDYLSTLEHLNVLIDDAQNAYIMGNQPAYSAFLSEQEFLEELAVYSRRVTDQITKISSIYAPIVSEFQPEASRKRGLLRALVFAGVGANILLSLFLAVSFGRNTVERLEVLMRKLTEFAAGRNESPPIDGNDEIAELDKTFTQMAALRTAADELKRSVQAMVSHDLRAPLTSVLARLQLCQEGVYGEIDEPMSKTLQTIESEVQRLIRLSNDLLDMERLDGGKLELHPARCAAEKMVSAAIQAVSVQAEIKQLSIETDVDPKLELDCDQSRVVQILINFLSNAVKFSPRKSAIAVRVKKAEGGSKIRFEVVDCGKGLSSAELDRVFEKFVQLPQSAETQRQGSGLGLSICKQLVELHGGTIGVEANATGGCTFWFIL